MIILSSIFIINTVDDGTMQKAQNVVDLNNDLINKVKDDEKEKLEDLTKKVKDALEGDDTDEIKKASEELSNAVMELSSRVYQEQAAESQANAENGNSDDEEPKSNVKDADFEEK